MKTKYKEEDIINFRVKVYLVGAIICSLTIYFILNINNFIIDCDNENDWINVELREEIITRNYRFQVCIGVWDDKDIINGNQCEFNNKELFDCNQSYNTTISKQSTNSCEKRIKDLRCL